jgi:hypothetical protein
MSDGDGNTPIPGEGQGPQNLVPAADPQGETPVSGEPTRPTQRGVPSEEMRVVTGSEGTKGETLRQLREDAHRGEAGTDNPQG